MTAPGFAETLLKGDMIQKKQVVDKFEADFAPIFNPASKTPKLWHKQPEKYNIVQNNSQIWLGSSE
ncbi:hypothetical protein GCM10022277_43620 [Litoribacillus peritrichatus]|uniref:Uncharacterized protein n=1 Tax=Litoribacillus peritrichatus TaxID=718191 RepID=A0ABP7NCT0_9GAMM